MKALVTGASGFVGRILVEDLLGRGISTLPGMRASTGEIDGSTKWEPHLADIDVVFHLAGRAHAGSDASDDSYRRINVDGTRRLAEACVAAGVGRLVFLSSIKVNGEETDQAPYTAKSLPRPLDIYGRSKLEAEEALKGVCASGDLSYTIIRTPLVYGEGVKANFFNLVRAIDRGIPLPFGAISNRRSLMYVRNLTDVLIHVSTSATARDRTYLVSDGDDVSTPELVRRIADALGRKSRLLPVPVWLLRLAGMMTGHGAAVLRLTSSLEADSSSVRQETGWGPPYSMRQGLDATAAWYRHARVTLR